MTDTEKDVVEILADEHLGESEAGRASFSFPEATNMQSTMKNDSTKSTRPTMVTPYRFIKLGEIKEGVIALFQIGEHGEALQTSARWDERLQAYVHNGAGETLSMYDYDHLRPQLEREGIEHEPLTR